LSEPGPFVFGSMVVLLGALVLSLFGLALILYGARMVRIAVAKRVDLIRREAGRGLPALPATATLIRAGPHGTKEGERAETARVLARVGIGANWAAAGLIASRMFTIVILGLMGFMAASHWLPVATSRLFPVLAATGCGLGGWFLPGIVIGKLLKSRTKAVVAGLPDALELLVICVEAGLSFEEGIDRIAVGMRLSQPALAVELALTSADLKILPSREEALSKLSERVDMPSVHSVTTTLSQTLRYGTPLAQALRMVAEELRNDTLIRLEERANQLPTLMTIPMMLFIMPTIFMIVGGPAVWRVMDIFGH
jgi:tight adherence protein C